METQTSLSKNCVSQCDGRKNNGSFEMAKNNSYQLFVYQFEREDAEAASLEERRLGRPQVCVGRAIQLGE
jgi:hypothetical protein